MLSFCLVSILNKNWCSLFENHFISSQLKIIELSSKIVRFEMQYCRNIIFTVEIKNAPFFFAILKWIPLNKLPLHNYFDRFADCRLILRRKFDFNCLQLKSWEINLKKSQFLSLMDAFLMYFQIFWRNKWHIASVTREWFSC